MDKRISTFALVKSCLHRAFVWSPKKLL